MSFSAHRVEFPSQAFNSLSFWGVPQNLGQHIRQKRFQQAGLGQHTQKVCTLPFAASPVFHTFTSGSTEHSAQGSEEISSIVLKQLSAKSPLLESPQNPQIAGSADPRGICVIPTPGFEPDGSALLVS